MTSKTREEIKRWRRRFRHVLKGWTIHYNTRSRTKRKVVMDWKRKRATVYAFGKRKVPTDYALHEVLHACIRAVETAKDWSWREELFIRALCALIQPLK
jgi:hypothetical protein